MVYCAVTKVFCKNEGENVEQRFEKPEILNVFERDQTLLNASESFRMHSSRSENFEILAKTLKNLAKTWKNYANIFTKTFFTAQYVHVDLDL